MRQVSHQPTVQLKCSKCEQEESRVQRSFNPLLFAGKENNQIQRLVGGELPDTTEDRGNLKSDELAGDPELEACFNGQHRMMAPERSQSVGRVQTALDKLGYSLPNSGIDEKFGSETGAAVTKFKEDNGIQPSDPVVGKKTIATLDARVSGSNGGKPPQGKAGCKFSVVYSDPKLVTDIVPPGRCGAAVQYNILKVVAKGRACPKKLEGLQLTEDVVADHGCSPPDMEVKTGAFTIGPNGHTPNATDTYGMFMPKKSEKFPCHEELHQLLFVDGKFADSHTISFTFVQDCVIMVMRDGKHVGTVES